MKTIHRYELPVIDRPVVDMPRGARILSAPPSMRNADLIEIWAEVDTSEPMEPRYFRVIRTGNPLPNDRGSFIGTAITYSGMYVWHVFEAAVGAR